MNPLDDWDDADTTPIAGANPVVACTAIFGDSTINYYRGPIGPRALKIIDLLNSYEGEDGTWDMFEVLGPVVGEYDGEITNCDTEDELIDNLIWWANNGEEEANYEYDPRQHDIDI